jgi:CubicO group peptidase (beta-lactamase class C family)
MPLAQVIDAFKNEKPDFPPGEGWHYNNSAYVLDSAIIEAVSGMPWHVYLKKTLFDPLGLVRTGYGDETAAAIPDHVMGYSFREGHWAVARYIDMSVPNGAGALVSTVDDLPRWNRALHEGKALKSDSYRQMITPTGNAVKDKYGFGIWHETLRGTDMLQHRGDIFGFSAYLIYLPQEHLSVAALYNTDFDSTRPGNMNVETLARPLAAFAIGKPYPEKKPIAVDTTTLGEYEGVYRIEGPCTRTARDRWQAHLATHGWSAVQFGSRRQR